MQEEGEHFSLDDVSDDNDNDNDDNDNDNEMDHQPLPRSRARDRAPTAQDINDPEIPPSDKGAADTKYFFEKTETHQVCRECR